MKRFVLLVVFLASSVSMAAAPTDDFQTISIWLMDVAVDSNVLNAGQLSGVNRILRLGEDWTANGFTNHASITTGSAGVDGEALYFPGLAVARAKPFYIVDWTDIEVDFWMKVETFAGSDAGYTSYMMLASGVFQMDIDQANLRFMVLNNSGTRLNGSLPCTQNISSYANQWLHVVAGYDSTTQGIFMTVKDASGTLIGSDTMWVGAALNARNTNLEMGAWIGKPAARGFKGWIDNVKFSTNSLETPSYAVPYQDGLGIFGLWHMNEFVDKNGEDAVLDDDSASIPRDHDMISVESILGGIGPMVDANEVVLSQIDPNAFGPSMYFDGWSDLYLEADTENGDTLGMSEDNWRLEAWFKMSQDGIDYYEENPDPNAQLCIFQWVDNIIRIYIRSVEVEGVKRWELLGRARFDYPADTYLEEAVIYGTVSKESLVQWHHVALNYKDGVMTMYFDGQVFGSTTLSQSGAVLRHRSRPLRIGPGFWGWIDDARFSQLRCGDWGYSLADLNKDCYVNFLDFAQMANDWVKCSIPAGETPDVPYQDGLGTFGLWHMNEFVDKNGEDAVLDDDSASIPRDHDMISFESTFGGIGPMVDANEVVSSQTDPNIFGPSMYFDGWSDLYLEADTATSDKLGMSEDGWRIEAWFKISQDGIDYYGENPDPNANAEFYIFQWVDNIIRIYVRSVPDVNEGTKHWELLGRARFDYPAGTYLQEGVVFGTVSKESLVQWHHVSLNYKDGVMTLYLDGQVFGSTTLSQSDPVLRHRSKPLRIGPGFWGWIDEARLSQLRCGDSLADLNKDCYVNFLDLAQMANNWLKCSDPIDANCISF